MTLEDLRDQLKEQFTELWGKIEESPTYNTLRERFETLSPNAQNAIKLSAVALAVALLIYFPYSMFSTSWDNVEVFEDKRDVIRKLLRASRSASEAGGMMDNPPPLPMLAQNVRNRLQSFALLPEQIGSIQELDKGALGGNYAPAEIEQSGVSVELKQLNLKQVVEIGFGLQNMGPGVRLVDLQMVAQAKDPHYFDVVYKLARFSLPAAEESAPAPSNERSRRRPSPRNEDEE